VVHSTLMGIVQSEMLDQPRYLVLKKWLVHWNHKIACRTWVSAADILKQLAGNAGQAAKVAVRSKPLFGSSSVPTLLVVIRGAKFLSLGIP